MVFHIQRGLFMSDFTDYYAVLGVPVNADSKEIRKSYLKIARRLHPDSSGTISTAEKQLAEQLLSKLVNPAWERLSQEHHRTEYGVVLKLKGQSASRQTEMAANLGPRARQLLAANNPELFYQSAVQDLAVKQYEKLENAIDLTGQLSELNLAFLMRTEGNFDSAKAAASASQSANAPASTPAGSPTTTTQSRSVPAAKPNPSQSLAESFYNRAELAYKRQNYAQAILELRDALKLEPKNVRCYCLMGMVYLAQNQAKMARLNFEKALEFDPTDETARAGLQRAQAMTAAQTKTGGAATKPAGKPPQGKSGGFFGGLFGKKK